jgi:hypothetical protein
MAEAARVSTSVDVPGPRSAAEPTTTPESPFTGRSREDAADGIYIDEIVALLMRIRRRVTDLRGKPYQVDPDTRGMSLADKQAAWRTVTQERARLRRELEYTAHMADKVRLLILDELHLAEGRSSHMISEDSP